MSSSPTHYLSQISPTPLVPVALDPGGRAIHCKLEFLNPSGSTKDRIASFILRKALRRGDLAPGGRVVEASSGSTSISMAMVSAQLGLRFLAVMPEGVSNERSLIIRAFGGEVLLSPRAEGLAGAVRRAHEESKEGAYFTRQFENPDNAAAHRHATAREILDQVPSERIDAVVSGVGTGGTLVGLYHGFRDHGCPARPFAARPVAGAGARVESGCFTELECSSFSARIPGVVAGMSRLYRPDDLEDLEEIDVPDDEALETTRRLIRRGFPVGPSSGLNYAAALRVAARHPAAEVIVTVFPDRMERYFSTELFAEVR